MPPAHTQLPLHHPPPPPPPTQQPYMPLRDWFLILASPRLQTAAAKQQIPCSLGGGKWVATADRLCTQVAPSSCFQGAHPLCWVDMYGKEQGVQFKKMPPGHQMGAIGFSRQSLHRGRGPALYW